MSLFPYLSGLLLILHVSPNLTSSFTIFHQALHCLPICSILPRFLCDPHPLSLRLVLHISPLRALPHPSPGSLLLTHRLTLASLPLCPSWLYLIFIFPHILFLIFDLPPRLASCLCFTTIFHYTPLLSLLHRITTFVPPEEHPQKSIHCFVLGND